MLSVPAAPHTATRDDEHSDYQASNHNSRPKCHQIIGRLRASRSWKASKMGATHARLTNQGGENDRPGNDNRPGYERESFLHTCISSDLALRISQRLRMLRGPAISW